VIAAAASALYVHLAELITQINVPDPHLSPVTSLSVIAAAAPVESFPFKPVAQVEEPAPTFPSAVSIDLAAVSVAVSLSAPSVDADGYVDSAQSTVHGHFQQSHAAVAAGTTNDHAPAKASTYVNTALPASYVPSATAAQCFGAPSSFLGRDC
jgi:hypothetical protein